MRAGRPAEPVLWLAGAAGIGLIAIVQTTIFYRASPMLGLVVPIGLAFAGAVMARPMLGVCAGLVAVALEVVGTQISPMEALLLLTAGAVALRWGFGIIRLEIDPVFFVLAAALLWMTAGLGVAEDQFVVIRTVLMWSAFALVALYVSNASPPQIRQVLWSILFAAAATAAIAVLSGTAQEARAGATAVEGRAQGSFTHPNQLAFFLVMALPPGLVLAVKSKAALRYVAVGATGVIFTALLLTLTRGAIIGAACSLAIMLVWAPFRRIAGVVLVFLLLFAVANGDALSRSKELNLVGARLATVFDRESATVNNGRLQIWAKVPQMSLEHPFFGVGTGNFYQHSLAYGLSEGGFPFGHAHNVALTVLVEQGIVGAGLLVLTLVFIFRAGAAALRRRSHEDFPYALAAIAGLSGLFVNSLTDYPPGSNPNMALLLIEIGVLIAVTRQLRRSPP